MRPFDDLFAISAECKGGADALEALLTKPKSTADLVQISGDRWLG